MIQFAWFLPLQELIDYNTGAIVQITSDTLITTDAQNSNATPDDTPPITTAVDSDDADPKLLTPHSKQSTDEKFNAIVKNQQTILTEIISLKKMTRGLHTAYVEMKKGLCSQGPSDSNHRKSLKLQMRAD